jgi:hypothetical protein
MSDWWLMAQVSAPALGSVALCLGLRRYVRAVLWNVLLRQMGVDVAERRDLALRAARRDLRINGSVRAHRQRRSKAPATPERPCRAERVRGL